MPCSCKSSPYCSPSFETRSVPVALTASITIIATTECRQGRNSHCQLPGLSSNVRAAAIKQTGKMRGRIGNVGCEITAAGGGILTARKQTQRQRSPDAAETVDRHGADRIVDSQVLQQFHAQVDNHAGDCTQNDRTGWTDPIARASNCHQASQEPVNREAHVPLLARDPRRKHRRQTAGTSGQRGIRGNTADAFVSPWPTACCRD